MTASYRWYRRLCSCAGETSKAPPSPVSPRVDAGLQFGLQWPSGPTPPNPGLRFPTVSTQAAAGVRREIERQQHLDRQWQQYQGTLEARLAAVAGARQAFSERQLGADWALRQSLVDLASV